MKRAGGPSAAAGALNPAPTPPGPARPACAADRSKLVRRFKKRLREADVRPAVFHELRHTFGTRTATSGVPLRTIQHWMGHADAKTTQVYAHYQPSGAEAEVIDAVFR